MGSPKRNNEIHIDNEALTTLAMAKEGILSPVDKLMNRAEAEEVDKTARYKGCFFPFSFILAPAGTRNENVLKEAKKGDLLYLVVDGENRGEIIVEDIFKIDRLQRIEKIFGTTDPGHPGVKETMNRLGNYAVSGDYKIDCSAIRSVKNAISLMVKRTQAKKVSALMISGKPLHRGHERFIRMTLEQSDLLVLFLLKPYKKDIYSYDLRLKILKYFVDNFLPRNKVLIVPFENTYIFAGFNNIILDAIAARNFGCTDLAVGQNHAGIGLYYDKTGTKSIVDQYPDLNIRINVSNEFVYCNECKTLVSTKTCPHGSHHHIAYNSEFILELLNAGVLPPAVLVRKEISAILLSNLYPNRFDNIIQKFNNFFPSEGLLEEMTEEKFYLEIMKLHQTVSLT
ncbi:MAG: sulfate adenylyltransferase [Sulfurospirillum sp.]|nr:MAG: sulfate adenylyltransferase [Sulfurospirillum sp.]